MENSKVWKVVGISALLLLAGGVVFMLVKGKKTKTKKDERDIKVVNTTI
jgi:hypothetical protein